MKFVTINKENKHYVNQIKGKPKQRCLVHYNAHWLGQSIIKEDVNAFLIEEKESYIAFLAIGQYYEDEYLQQPKTDYGEIIHIVVDEKFQGKGFGKTIVLKAIEKLKKEYKNIYAVISKENNVSLSLFTSLGFKKTENKNYDGDDIFKLKKIKR